MTAPELRVLIVEDDASMSRMVRHLLELEGFTEVRHAWNGQQALETADQTDIVLLDHQLPDMSGMDLLPRLLDRARPPAVIMVTGHGSESLAAAALRAGAVDYLTKDHTLADLLPRVVERVRRTRQLQLALADAERELVGKERLAAIGEMAVALHHEINNPLTAALAEVDLALEERGLPAATREGLTTAREALLRIRDTVQRAVDLKRSDPVPYLADRQMIPLDSPEPGKRSVRPEP